MLFRKSKVAHGLVLGLLATLGAQTPAAAQVTTVSATTLRAVKGVRGTAPSVSAGITFTNVPGATATFTVPPSTTDLFIARFSAESACWGVAGWGVVRILINGVEMDPAAGTDFAFDSTNAGAENPTSYESHSMERSKVITNTSTAPLTVTVQVQYRITNSGIFLRLDDWHLTVQQFN